VTPPDLGQVGAGWPVALSMAAAVTVRGLAAGRRRTAMNEALHELRRPLQALALAAHGGSAEPVAPAGSVQLAAVALERLEREINGGPAAVVRAPVPVRPLLEGAVERWSGLAARVGSNVRLRWEAGEASISGDRWELSQALDNLIANAIEHGGPEVTVRGRIATGVEVVAVEIAIVDSGRGEGAGNLRDPVSTLLSRLSGRRRHGHGLRVVQRIAEAHGGEFRLRRRRPTEAILELPLLAGGR
jgi:signal transduction histidine kinase